LLGLNRAEVDMILSRKPGLDYHGHLWWGHHNSTPRKGKGPLTFTLKDIGSELNYLYECTKLIYTVNVQLLINSRIFCKCMTFLQCKRSYYWKYLFESLAWMVLYDRKYCLCNVTFFWYIYV